MFTKIITICASIGLLHGQTALMKMVPLPGGKWYLHVVGNQGLVDDQDVVHKEQFDFQFIQNLGLVGTPEGDRAANLYFNKNPSAFRVQVLTDRGEMSPVKLVYEAKDKESLPGAFRFEFLSPVEGQLRGLRFLDESGKIFFENIPDDTVEAPNISVKGIEEGFLLWGIDRGQIGDHKVSHDGGKTWKSLSSGATCVSNNCRWFITPEEKPQGVKSMICFKVYHKYKLYVSYYVVGSGFIDRIN